MSVRRPLLLWHRWFGVLAALWLFLIAATGAVLVFHDEIDHLLNPELFTASAGAPMPIDRVAAAAVAGRPAMMVRFIDLADAPGEPHVAWLGWRPEAEAKADASAWQVFVDPATARVLGARDYEAVDLSRRGLMNFLYKFHYSLHAGEWVTWALGILALLWVLDHVAAAILAFPSQPRWRESFRIRRSVAGHKRVFDLHRAGGLWLLPITLTLAVSGVYFNLNEQFEAVVGAVSPLTPRPDEALPKLATPSAIPAIGFDRALAAAAPAHADGIVYNADKALYWVRAFDPRDIDSYGRRWIFVDARSGRVVADMHPAQGSAGDVIMAWQFPLHSGKAFGWPGRLAICAAGIATCAFIVTGLMMWSRKRRARRVTATRRQGGVDAMPAPAE